MPPTHFMRADLVSTLIATGVFTLIAFIPGYVMGWATDLLDFRSHTPGWKFVISVPVSIAICPILAYWIDNLAGPRLVWTALGICWAVFGFLLLKAIWAKPIHWGLPSKTSACFGIIAILWIALVLGSVLDLQFGDRLYATVTAADQAFRTAFTDAITRTGIAHAQNPLYGVHGTAPMRYHYFWFILCSLVDQLGGSLVPARQALVASTIWCGIALACIIAAYLRFFSPQGSAHISGRTLKGILLLAVTGLDIIPTLALALAQQPTIYKDMEAWNEAVTSWFGSLLWVPNHVGGLISGLIAFLVLWHAASATRPRQKWMAAAVAGIALANMLGTSIYVGLVFAVFLSIWTLITFQAGWRNHTAVLLVAGLLAILLALPYLKSLSAPAAGGSFIQLTVRNFKGARAFHLQTEFPEPWKTYAARLVLLPLNYLLELGFFLIVGILHLARFCSLKRFTPDSVAGVTMTLTSVCICTFVKSAVAINNDLGWRGFLPAQFMLLIWAVEMLPAKEEQGWGANRWLYAYLSPLLPLALVIGLVSTTYSLGVLRVAEILNDRGPGHAAGKRMYAARQIYERLRAVLPATAVVQENPDLENQIFYGLYANRQTAVGDRVCGSLAGGDPQACSQVYPAVAAAYDGEGYRLVDVDVMCRRLGIDALIVTSGDPVWNVRDSWVWKKQPFIATDYARAFLTQPIAAH